MWFRIAERTGLSPTKAKEQTPATEFWRWIKYFEEEWAANEKQDWYMAQIAYEVAMLRWQVATMFAERPVPPKWKVDTFLLKFQDKDKPPTGESREGITRPPLPRRTQQREAFFDESSVQDGTVFKTEQEKVEEQKQIWFAWLGMGAGGETPAEVLTKKPKKKKG